MLKQQKCSDFCGITVCAHRDSSLFYLFFFLRRTLVLNDKATVSRGFKFLFVYKPSPASINDFRTYQIEKELVLKSLFCLF